MTEYDFGHGGAIADSIISNNEAFAKLLPLLSRLLQCTLRTVQQNILFFYYKVLAIDLKNPLQKNMLAYVCCFNV